MVQRAGQILITVVGLAQGRDAHAAQAAAQFEANPRGPEGAGLEGSYDRVAAFARQWKAGSANK